jgi:hypothetical protein
MVIVSCNAAAYRRNDGTALCSTTQAFLATPVPGIDVDICICQALQSQDVAYAYQVLLRRTGSVAAVDFSLNPHIQILLVVDLRKRNKTF